jgi:HKD family nuclease
VPFEPLAQPHGDRVGDRLIAELSGGGWNRFRCAVAFAKLSGVRYLDGPLRAFAASGGAASIAVGVDHDGTSFEAVSQLVAAVEPGGDVSVVKHLGSPSPTFHPKVFLFTADNANAAMIERALLVSGSTNLTEGGLFTNYEFASAWTPTLTNASEAAVLAKVVNTLDMWTDTTSGLCVRLSAERLEELHNLGWLPTEARIASTHTPGGSSSRGVATAPPSGLRKQPQLRKVGHSTTMGPPAFALPTVPVPAVRRRGARRPSPAAPVAHKALVIDISTGTRLTEVFLSKTALNEDKAFFGHPFTGLTSPRIATAQAQPELSPRPVVDIVLVGANGQRVSTYQEHEIKIWEYVNGPSANMDVRMIIPQDLLRSLPTGCILEMRRTPIRAGLDYSLEFLSPGSQKWTEARAAATKKLPGGKRSYGWL